MQPIKIKPLRDVVVKMQGEVVKRTSFTVPSDTVISCLGHEDDHGKFFSCDVDTEGSGYKTTIVRGILSVIIDPSSASNKWPFEAGSARASLPIKAGTACKLEHRGAVQVLHCKK